MLCRIPCLPTCHTFWIFSRFYRLVKGWFQLLLNYISFSFFFSSLVYFFCSSCMQLRWLLGKSTFLICAHTHTQNRTQIAFRRLSIVRINRTLRPKYTMQAKIKPNWIVVDLFFSLALFFLVILFALCVHLIHMRFVQQHNQFPFHFIL